ncbi:MAG: hypothetical protein I4N51_04070 [Acinetobacter sp.]|nr:hypothetical protein [Acinetobacter sp.]
MSNVDVLNRSSYGKTTQIWLFAPVDLKLLKSMRINKKKPRQDISWFQVTLKSGFTCTKKARNNMRMNRLRHRYQFQNFIPSMEYDKNSTIK